MGESNLKNPQLRSTPQITLGYCKLTIKAERGTYAGKNMAGKQSLHINVWLFLFFPVCVLLCT